MCKNKQHEVDKRFMHQQLHYRAEQIHTQYRSLVLRKDRYAIKLRSELLQQLNLCKLIDDLLNDTGVISDEAAKAFDRLTEPRRLSRKEVSNV